MTINGISSSLTNPVSTQQASERISSGERINSASDDPAGLALSNTFANQAREFSRSINNAVDGVSLLQVANGGLNSINSSLERIRELSIQSLNGTLNELDREALNQEATQLRAEVVSTVQSTSFNGQSLFDNSDAVSIQIGDNEAGAIDIGINNFLEVLSDNNFDSLNLSSGVGAANALDTIDRVQDQLNSSFAELGANTNRLESAISSLLIGEVSANESRSRISDTDIAKEVTSLTQEQIRSDIGTSIQAQSNQRSSDVLRLLSF